MNSEFPVFVKCERTFYQLFFQNSINALNRRENSEKSVLKKRPWSFRKTSCSFLKRTKSFSKTLLSIDKKKKKAKINPVESLLHTSFHT